MDEELLTAKQVGQRLQVSEATLASWRHAGTGPTFTKLGRLIRYRSQDVDSFVDGGLRRLPGRPINKRDA